MFVSVAGLYCVYLAKLETYFLQFCSLNGSDLTLTKTEICTQCGRGKWSSSHVYVQTLGASLGPSAAHVHCHGPAGSLWVAAGPTQPSTLTRPGVWADLWPRMPALCQATYIIQIGGLQVRRGRCRLQQGRNLGFRTPCGFQCIGAPPVLYIHLPFLTVSTADFRPRARYRGNRLTHR